MWIDQQLWQVLALSLFPPRAPHNEHSSNWRAKLDEDHMDVVSSSFVKSFVSTTAKLLGACVEVMNVAAWLKLGTAMVVGSLDSVREISRKHVNESIYCLEYGIVAIIGSQNQVKTTSS